MIELIQFPWSPFCIVQRRLLEASGAKFKLTNLPQHTDRNLIWKLTRQQYHAVPVIKDGRQVVFESGDDTQDIAKYIDAKLKLGLFPAKREGVQSVLWRYFEHEVEAVGFKLNDIYFREFVSRREQVTFVRHKERKFGRGCLDQWRAQQADLQEELEKRLLPAEQMLAHSTFLMEDHPLFVDFNLYGMVGNYLYSGHYQIPKGLPNLVRWYHQMRTVKIDPRQGIESGVKASPAK